MIRTLARAVSILGHPMLVLPLAAMFLTLARGEARNAGWIGLGFAVFAAIVMGYSQWKVTRGQWRHVDASGQAERKSLNFFLLLALLVSMLLAALSPAPAELGLGLGLSALMVGVAMLTARWWKLSLHLAFVVFAAAMLATVSVVAAEGLLLFSMLVAWSRLQLQRHVPRDLLAGACTGALAGLAFVLISNRVTG